MRVLDRILCRLGLVRIRSFGLELTRDGRLRSQHAIVLADGWGGPIVGWTADDAAPTVLEPWRPAPALPEPAASDDDDWDAKIAAIRAASPKTDQGVARTAAAPVMDEDESDVWVDEPATILDPPRPSAAVTASVVKLPPIPPRPRIPPPPPPPAPRLPAITAPPAPPRRMPKGTRTRAAVADPWKHEPTSPTKLSPVQIAALEREALAKLG